MKNKLTPINIAIAAVAIAILGYIAYNSHQTRKMAERQDIMNRANALIQSSW